MSKVFCLVVPVVLVGLMLWGGGGMERAPGGLADGKEERGGDLAGRVMSGTAPGVSERVSGRALLGRLESGLVAKLDGEERRLLERYLEVLSGEEDQVWCWSEGTREEKVAAFVEAERMVARERGMRPLANQFLPGGRWSETAVDGFGSTGQGDPVVVTWSVVPDGTLVPGTSGLADGGSDLREWLAGIYGGSATGRLEGQPWFGLFEEAFGAMAATCGVELRFEPNDDGQVMGGAAPGVVGVRGDIRIGSRFLDGGGGFLGISLGPNNGDMVIDSGEVLFDQIGGNSLRLFNTLTHEIGHCLGLGHVCPLNQTKLMEPNLSTAFRGPQFDEFQSLQRLYGDALESHDGFRDNDGVESAVGLEVPVGGWVSRSRLSIDDDQDVDFFRVDALNGQRLSVEVIPGEGSYGEGAEGGGGCSGGVIFQSGMVHDLRIEVLDRDGETVLMAVDQFGPGGVEVVEFLELPRTGSYFVKVAGGLVNAAQLYELRLGLAERLPGPRLVLGEGEVVAESGVVKNGRADPGETVRVRFPLVNEGISPTGQLAFLVSGSANVVVFAQAGPEGLAAGGVGELEVVFGAAGDCGDEAVVEVRVEDGLGGAVEEIARFGLGEILLPVPFEANFDGGRALPVGWVSEETGGGGEWEALSSRFDTPLRSAFSGGSGVTGEAMLLSPSFELGSGGGTLSFRHLYRTEVGFDGGVLEVRRDGGAWVDVVTGYGLPVTGGYDRLIREGFGSAIAGRMAWSGRLTEFVLTSVSLPAVWAGEELQFRWRFVQDRSGVSEGWWVDTVKMEMVVEDCVEHRPALNLWLKEGGLDENYPDREAVLVLESELPLLEGFAVSLVPGGTAGAADYAGALSVTFPAGGSRVEIPLRVRRDDLVEGEEFLTVSVPGDGVGFAAGGNATVVLRILDRVNLSEWLQGGFGVPVLAGGDQDGDGVSGLGEYLLGTDPTEGTSRPDLSLVPRDGGYLIPVGILPVRDDAVLGVEVSGDLVGWDEWGYVRLDEGLWVSSSGGWRFLRLTFRGVE